MGGAAVDRERDCYVTIMQVTLTRESCDVRRVASLKL